MLITSSLFVVLSNAITFRRDKTILYSRIAIIIMIYCLILCLNSSFIEFQSSTNSLILSETIPGKGLTLFSGLYNTSAITHTFHIFIIIITAIILSLNAFYPRKLEINNSTTSGPLTLLINKIYYKQSGAVIDRSAKNPILINKMSLVADLEQFKIIEYPLIILFIVIGGMFLICSYDLISIFLSIELQSYGLYILCAIYRNSERAISGALSYFLLGGLSSCFILLGSAFLYSNSGNTNFDGLYIINKLSRVHGPLEGFNSLGSLEGQSLNLALIIISVGFLFKVSAAPFHNWSPDVYDSIPTLVTTFVAVFAKISILVLLLEMVHYTTYSDIELISISDSQGFGSISGGFISSNKDYTWKFGILISSLLSLIIGSVLGLTQYRIKRLYAYSTISHIGFLLLALSINSIESIQSFLFYLMQYTLSNLNAFLLLLSIGYYSYMLVERNSRNGHAQRARPLAVTASRGLDQKPFTRSNILDKNNSPIQLINQIKGYFYINSFLAVSLAITLFSFVGIPPLIGFFGKQMILSSALDSGYIFMSLIAILTSAISAYYYLFLVKQMFFEKTDYILNPKLKSLNYKIDIINRFKRSATANKVRSVYIEAKNIHISSSISIIISILTLIILLFLLAPVEWLNMVNILTLSMFN